MRENMKIVIAPDSFKECLRADQVAKAIQRGFEQAISHVDCLLCPVGDGGEGTISAIGQSLNLEEKFQEVTGPFGQKLAMPYFLNGETALFEVADLVGLGKIPVENRNPLKIQTRGIGELIRYLIEQGIKKIYIGVGGTASNDGGIGIAAGLGYQFYDRDGNVLPACGQSLLNLASMLTENRYEIPDDVEIRILADVTSPLCGHKGATYTFGKQKGLEPCLFEKVDQAIESFYKKTNPPIIKLEGAGAGGGIAAGL